jgi:uroporphyrinogen decarboxylase
MTSKERVRAAIEHRAADRTAITFDAEKEVYAALHAHLGTSTKEALFDALHVDTWMLLPGCFIYPEGEDDKLEKTSIWGYRNRVTAYSGGTYDELCYSPLAGHDDVSAIDAHPWPSPDVLDFSHYTKDAAVHENRAIIGVFTWGSYFIASFVRGLEALMMDMAFRQEYAHHLIDTITEISAAALERMLSEHGDGIDIVYMADDTCTQRGPLFSPALFAEFVQPYLRRYTEICHRYDKKFLLHTCGGVRPFLPMIIDAGVDMLEPVQVSASGMDAEELKRDFGRDLCFYGGVDLQEVLCKRSPAGVADEVKRLIDVLGVDGGYIIGPGHTYIQVDAPIANIMAMYETAANYTG